ncbi:hypothetical protein E2C01_030735 [Portunus trituberculatus]|uniref:Uncharacterized protein n=1 Tax=Portunus trituberculatus TaxID=210409 RepID=A0A5B7ERL5_PORTR|nr:hypothetical protein [Portunus trituberculatus]
MRNSSNMVLLTFFYSTLPDRVHIGPINLRVLSRQCPRYRLEQDILQLANSQFFNLGSARRELLYRQKDGTVSPKLLKGLNKRHCSSEESIDLAQVKQSKISNGAHNRESFRDQSAMAAPMVPVEPAVTLFVSDQGSCDKGVHDMESSNDVKAVPCGRTWNCRGLRAWREELYSQSSLQPVSRYRRQCSSDRFTKRRVPCWSAARTNTVRQKRAAFSRLRRHRGDPQCLEAFRRCRARARRVLKEAQRAFSKTHVSSINVRTPLTDVLNKVRRIAGKFSAPSPPVLLSARRTVPDPKTVTNLYAEHFASVSRNYP